MTSILSLLVEGDLDAAVGIRVLEHVGVAPGVIYGKRGIDYIRTKIRGFNGAAAGVPILAIADFMDTNAPCPSHVVSEWLGDARHPNMLFRLVVNELESWLIADRPGLASFLHVGRASIPYNPEELADPKRELIELARQSSSTTVRRLLVPQSGSTAQQGPGYTSEMSRFVRDHWDIVGASGRAESLRRCIAAIAGYRERTRPVRPR